MIDFSTRIVFSTSVETLKGSLSCSIIISKHIETYGFTNDKLALGSSKA